MLRLLFALLAIPAQPAPAPAARATISVDVTQLGKNLGPGLSTEAAYKSLLVRLTEDGFGVIADSQASDIALTVRKESAASLAVDVRVACRSQHDAISIGTGSLSENYFGLVHSCMQLARQARESLPSALEECSPPDTPRPALGLDPVTAEERPVRQPARGPATVSGGVLSFATKSSEQQGFGLGAEAQLELLANVRAHLTGLVYLPTGVDPSLSLKEWFLLVGLSHRLRLSEGLTWENAIGCGPLLHAYGFTTSVSESTGHRLDVAATISTSLEARVVPPFALRLGVGALLAQHERRHFDDTGTLWRASHVRPMVSVGLMAHWLVGRKD